jgi:membrane associated rhomboid family serine protease
VHVNIRHVLANTLLLLLLGVQMERKYGSARLLLLWSLAVLGGGLLSVSADDPCKVVAGASGGVFGLVGLYAADLVRNYRTVKRPILQAAVVAALLVWLAVMAGGSKHGVSNMTHVGGLMWGLVPGLLFLNPGEPHWELVEAWATVLGAVGFVALAVALPTHVYLRRLPRVLELCGAAALIEP